MCAPEVWQGTSKTSDSQSASMVSSSQCWNDSMESTSHTLILRLPDVGNTLAYQSSTLGLQSGMLCLQVRCFQHIRSALPHRVNKFQGSSSPSDAGFLICHSGMMPLLHFQLDVTTAIQQQGFHRARVQGLLAPDGNGTLEGPRSF